MRTVGKVFKRKAEKKMRRPSKKEVTDVLRERGIPFDEKLSVDELIALIQKG